MTDFREVQPLRRNPAVWLAALATALLVGVPLSIPLVRENMTVGLALTLCAPVLLLLWLFAMRLETEVRDDGLWIRFRAGWPPKTYAWSRIQRAETVEYRPLRDFGGWGIRLRRREWAWIVWGKQAVRLHLHDGTSFLVGSAEPERLASAIQERLAANPSEPRRSL